MRRICPARVFRPRGTARRRLSWIATWQGAARGVVSELCVGPGQAEFAIAALRSLGGNRCGIGRRSAILAPASQLRAVRFSPGGTARLYQYAAIQPNFLV